MIKYAVFDLDGTLIDSTSKTPQILNEYSEKAIQTLVDNNIEIIIASGRPISFSKQLQENYYNRPMIICGQNGGIISDNNKIIEKHCLAYEDTLKILDLLRKFNNSAFIQVNLSGGRRLIDKFDDEVFKLRTASYGKNANIILNIDENLKEDDEIFKVLCVYNDKNVAEESKIKVMEKIKGKYNVTTCSDVFLEVTNVKANKGNIIDYLINNKKAQRNEIAVFGDSDNDLPMLKKVEYSYCMSVADENIKKDCYMIINNVYEGVKDILLVNNIN